MKEKIDIRPITAEDTDLIVRWRNSEHVIANFIDKNILTSESHMKWFNNFIQKGKVMQFIILSDGIEVGTTFIKNIEAEDSCPEFGYFIGEYDFLGKGIGTQAGKLTVNKYFESHNRNLIARAVADNISSDKALKKIGFRYNTTYSESDGTEVFMYEYDGDE